jgi:hypothetical protein
MEGAHHPGGCVIGYGPDTPTGAPGGGLTDKFLKNGRP